MKIAAKTLLGLCLGLRWPVVCLPNWFRISIRRRRGAASPHTWPRRRRASGLESIGLVHDDDLRFEQLPKVKGRVVFMGDSITDGWDLAKYFPGKPYVNRGIMARRLRRCWCDLS